MKNFLILFFLLLVGAPLWASNVVATNTDDTLTGWSICAIGSCGGGTPGGTNAPASFNQTINNPSPSLDGESMLLTETTLATSTQTNILFPFKDTTICDSCRYFAVNVHFYPSNFTSTDNAELDMFNYDVTDNLALVIGGQCNLTSGKWQYSNQTSGWQNTTIGCAINNGAWNTIKYVGHASSTTIYFDYVVINGVYSAINKTLPTTTLLSGYTTSAVGYQIQMDKGATTTAQTMSEYLDEASFTTSSTSGNPYFISTTGSDSNDGMTAGSAWLSPLHPLNCGDTITAAAGSYSAGNFGEGHWGTVNCPLNNNVAWLQCGTFDTCKIASTTDYNTIWVDQSYWGVQGWEVTVGGSATQTACFQATANTSTLISIHHVIFANDIANGCRAAGFGAYSQSATASVDYIAYIGDIVYNGSAGSAQCGSGLDIYQPIASDASPGTHIYVAGNFSYANVNPNPCGGTAPTDGEGINIDTLDFDQGGGTPYLQQVAVENNIVVGNGGRGIEVENNAVAPTQAPVYLKGNTSYGNMLDNNQIYCTGNGEIDIENAYNVNASYNLSQTHAATGCSSMAIYALSVANANSTDSVDYNYSAGVSGNNTFLYNAGSFAYGVHNVLGTSPAFASTTTPSAPSCGAYSNTVACMASVIAAFTPTVTAAKSYGYQTPTGANVTDPLYPTWLCNVTLPPGIINQGCAAGPVSTVIIN